MSIYFNSSYRCTRRRIPRSLVTVGTFFSYSPICKNAHIMSFVRKVVSVDYNKGVIVDRFGCITSFKGPDFYICVHR